MTSSRRRLRAATVSALVVLAPGVTAAALAVMAARTGGQAFREADASGALLALAGLALAGVLVWATVAAAAGVVEAWSPSPRPTGRDPLVVTPGPRGRGRGAVVSAGVAALVVAALTAPATASAAPAGPATVVASIQHTRIPGPAAADGERPGAVTGVADPGPAAGPGTPPPGSWSALADGFLAPRGASAGAAALVTAQPTRSSAAADREVVVVAGDTLWSLAARHLGPGADAAEVAEAWPAWWEANRAVVGDDPDLLLPGQRLVVPGR